MKVLYLITKSERGGAQIHVLDLVRTLGSRIEPVVACGDDGFLLEECRKLGVEVHIVPELVHPIRPLRDARAVLAVSTLLRECRCDIIHGHTGKAGLVARAAGWLTQTPAFYTVHSWSFVGTGRLTSCVASGSNGPCGLRAVPLLRSAVLISRWRVDAAWLTRLDISPFGTGCLTLRRGLVRILIALFAF